MSRSSALVVASATIVLLNEALVRAMAHGHVAHALLGAGNGAPPLGAALLAAALVLVRVLAIVIVPGALAMAAVGLVARHLAKSRSGAGISEAEGAGTSIGVRGTE